MPNRSFSLSAKGYRFGFNGKELENDIYGSGNAYDFGARVYDGRIGRWFSTDALEKKYPSYSPYIFPFNSPLLFADEDGNEGRIRIYIKGHDGKLTLVNTKHVYGHVFKTHTVEKELFSGTKFRAHSYNEYKHAYNYTQDVIIDMNANVSIGEKKAIGKSKASAPMPFFPETIAGFKADRQDDDKGLLGSFEIRTATQFEEWMTETFSQEEMSNFQSEWGAIFAASPSAPKDERVSVTKNSIKTQMKLLEILKIKDKDQKPFDTICSNCKEPARDGEHVKGLGRTIINKEGDSIGKVKETQ
jgi:RHS repeat-associated protein